MPRVDYSQTNEAEGFTPVPEGDYEVEIVKVEPRTTNDGDEMWGLQMKIINGPFSNKRLFDNMVFSSNINSMKRAKLICSRLGLDVSKELDLTEAMLVGKKCIVTTTIDEYKGEHKNKITFAGYKRIDAVKAPHAITTPEKTPSPAKNSLLEQIQRIGLDLNKAEHLAIMRELSMQVTGKASAKDLTSEGVNKLIGIMSGLSSADMVKEWIAWSKKEAEQKKSTDEQAPF